ncbi:MAG: phosphoribosylformylglycinamidine cyclo-ligase [Synergistaceae bacterium]|jgi:phosphoribosylformylglycinamidine cyclo-ligase|nr:phosphoribosylformylglycinamidine cyclo-ligase [Synergistaceae bacterium]
MDYRSAGVDIEAGDAWVQVVRRLVARRGSSLPSSGAIGGFSGLFGIGGGRSLAACCDGVGTKLALGEATGILRGLGQDLVAMNVNDLVTCGASPLFFLDYIACGRLDAGKMESVIEGILDACVESGCALLGGETAEMPGIYPVDGFDLAGFAVGLVNDAEIVSGSGINEGDEIIGLPSSGVHSNGFSLVRHALTDGGLKLPLDAKPGPLGGETLAETLMTPTRLYVRQTRAAMDSAAVKGMANITGGGLEANINRIFPDGFVSKIDYESWERPGIFKLIESAGVEEAEMRKVFNLGVGYAFIVSREETRPLLDALKSAGESPIAVGTVIRA